MTDDFRISTYVEAVKEQFVSGHAREHAYRPALERLMASFDDVTAVNDPKRSQHGNPDFIFVKKSNKNITFGYAEAKDITAELARTIKTEQLRRYAGYEKLFLTNYLDFKFFRNGEEYEEISLGNINNNELILTPNSFTRLQDVLQEFLNQPPETIRSGKRLALIMGAKTRRIRDNVAIYLGQEDSERNQELEKIFKMMKVLLVHDLTPEKFADMYAQTLVYGLFVARYNDKTSENFTRSEARDLVPASNPFLREFFDHIVGPRFDSRLAHIVDELCEVFSVSNVHGLIQKHLKLFEKDNEKDPIIHFYEDFLKEYDPAERKKMGAYYTPIPVVRFIIRQVDEILKSEFGLAKGLADNSKRPVVVRSQGTKHKIDIHRVQILDPAVGTATFLNEIIKYVHKSFKGQEGRWPAYAQQDLLPRLHGFELMMAPYTIAHLKLGMTLQETEVKDFKQRLGVYLTNTLEEGQKDQIDLFTQFGLAEVVSKEADEATKIKHERPIMVIIGNPPYSVESSNKTDYATSLVNKYKVEPGGQQKLQERNSKMINDDYVKFIAFAEEMIIKNGEGIVAMITNNGYLDNPTFRGMRWHLSQSFDNIYVLDLHGNAKKKETTPDGSKDENVFDIMQGVSIILAVKTTKTKNSASIYRADIYGKRVTKFEKLSNEIEWQKITPDAELISFANINRTGEETYKKGIKLDELFINSSSGISSSRDEFLVAINQEILKKRMVDFCNLSISDENLSSKYFLKETSDWKIAEARNNIGVFSDKKLVSINYRIFDQRWTYWDKNVNSRMRETTMNHLISRKNYGVVFKRGFSQENVPVGFISNEIIDRRFWSRPGMRGAESIAPLYLYHDDGTRTPNFKPDLLKELTKTLTKSYESEDILDYIYAVLHSPSYLEKYKEFLKIDFPRIPAPNNDAKFDKLTALGKRLRELHLMTSSSVSDYGITYSVLGSDEIEQISYEDEKVWINKTQYFGNVPNVAWNFYIGGYQPAQKWLKDRRGHKLSNQDIEHYQKIIKVLVETNKIMKRIDESWNP